MRARLSFLIALVVGLASAPGCGNQNYACAGVCSGGSGEWFGVISAGSLPDALNQCDEKYTCTGGETKNCRCYQEQ